jgi:hypothetical protein
MSRVAFAVLGVVLLATAPAAAQGPRGFQPLPDHWLTLDSLTEVLGLSAEQRTKVSEPYTALNAVLKQAANRRAQLRGSFQGRSPQEMTPEDRQAMRVRMDSLRPEFENLQAEADEWHTTIRNLLTAGQQPKFDALPKPRVFPMRRQGPPGS